MYFTPGQAKVLHAANKLRVRNVCEVNGRKYFYGDAVPDGLSEHEIANMLAVGLLEPTDRPLLQEPIKRETAAKPAAKPIVPTLPGKK